MYYHHMGYHVHRTYIASSSSSSSSYTRAISSCVDDDNRFMLKMTTHRNAEERGGTPPCLQHESGGPGRVPHRQVSRVVVPTSFIE